MRRVLVARPDGLGDVLLAGPAVRAVAASGAQVTMLAGPEGAPAAGRLPGVRAAIVARLPWIDADPEPVTRADFQSLVERLRAGRFDEAVILSSFHQSALPLALAARLAGIAQIAAISDDYPGSLLDLRHQVPEDLHEVERNLSLAGAAGHRLPAGDDGRLAVTAPAEQRIDAAPDRYVVVHPGASVAARTLSAPHWQRVVAALADAGVPVVVSGGPHDAALTRYVSNVVCPNVIDRGGTTDFDAMSALLRRADAVVVGNTGPAHLAAAVGTPVVSIFAPTVPANRWRPWMVPHVLLGDQTITCRGCRARTCPLGEQRCLQTIAPDDVVAAVHALAGARRAAA